MVITSKSTFQEVQAWASLFLEQNNHRLASSQHYIQWLMDWDLTQYVKNLSRPVGEEKLKFLQEAFEDIVNDKPLAYILGYQDFLGRRFKVTPDTLIPREETGGLIELARPFLKQRPQASVLDIGTGTGILAITLKKEFPQTQVHAVDISRSALEVAKENANSMKADIQFYLSDVYDQLPQNILFDFIISNPPYIAEDELQLMDQSVLKYEPKQALFADNQGLAMYHKIAYGAQNHVKDSSQILLEVGYRQGPAVVDIFNEVLKPRASSVLKDYNDLNRYVKIEI